MSKSILLADDSAVTRRAIRTLLQGKLGGECSCAEAADGAEAVEKVLALRPDVVVLDIAMPGLNGVEAARYIWESCPETAVLTISNYDVETVIPRVLQAGIRGFVPKGALNSELVPAIQALLNGKTYFNAGKADALKKGEPQPS